jgi:hypothetical protein
MMDALEIMLFGMLGIFLVMGMIIAVVYLLTALSKRGNKAK